MNLRNPFLRVSKIHKILRNTFNKRCARHKHRKNKTLLRDKMGWRNGGISWWHRLAMLKLLSQPRMLDYFHSFLHLNKLVNKLMIRGRRRCFSLLQQEITDMQRRKSRRYPVVFDCNWKHQCEFMVPLCTLVLQINTEINIDIRVCMQGLRSNETLAAMHTSSTQILVSKNQGSLGKSLIVRPRHSKVKV